MRRLEPFAASCVSVETARVFALDNMASAATAKCRSAQAECFSHVSLQLHRLASGRACLSDLSAPDAAPLDALTHGWSEIHSTERDLWNGLRDVCIDRAPAEIKMERLLDVLNPEHIERHWSTNAARAAELSAAYEYVQLAILPAVTLLRSRVEETLNGQQEPVKAGGPSDSEEDESSEDGPRRYVGGCVHSAPQARARCVQCWNDTPLNAHPFSRRSSRWLCRAVMKPEVETGGDGTKPREIELGEHPWHPVPLGPEHQVKSDGPSVSAS